ncbi:septation protein A [Kiloniella laminariae]|uniref:Inner membrane-spanning protein YciB n=1 Tax=Kiloniella laminariae TaxID=454162 RepID=A0ABT4LJR3_9PROT|nr:septation protein A [Kiloniella laminariae]MCZ4281350.1 septation protein A [Kiloniella laminariae]
MSRQKPGWMGPAIEYGPIAVFFAIYYGFDRFMDAYPIEALVGTKAFIAATAGLMVTTAIGIGFSLYYDKKIPKVPLFTAIIVMIFGGLTVYFDDESFYKMKPTIVQAIFAIVLLGGLFIFKRPLIKPLMQKSWNMTDEGWHILTFRFGLYFIAMAVLNEIVWRTQSESFWVNFKIFGSMVLMVAFIFSQYPVIRRYHLPDPDE